MELEDIVCSLEPSMELEELGIKQDSEFYWLKSFDSKYYLQNKYIAVAYKSTKDNKYSAFTVTELAKILKEESEKSRKIFEYLCRNLNRDKGLWCMSEPDWWANLLIKIIKHKK